MVRPPRSRGGRARAGRDGSDLVHRPRGRGGRGRGGPGGRRHRGVRRRNSCHVDAWVKTVGTIIRIYKRCYCIEEVGLDSDIPGNRSFSYTIRSLRTGVETSFSYTIRSLRTGVETKRTYNKQQSNRLCVVSGPIHERYFVRHHDDHVILVCSGDNASTIDVTLFPECDYYVEFNSFVVRKQDAGEPVTVKIVQDMGIWYLVDYDD